MPYKTYEVTVEKIYAGSAVVVLDNKWRARLIPADYNGPRHLIKGNSRFKALGELYSVEGTLCLRVKEVTGIL